MLAADILLLGSALGATPKQFYFATDTNRYYFGNSNGSVSIVNIGGYPVNTVDDFVASEPRNFLYTDVSGNLKSSPYLKLPVATITSATSIASNNTLILCTRSASDFTITLGITAGYNNKLFMFKRTDNTGGNINLTPSGGVLIDNSASLALGNREAAMVYFDGTSYWRLSR